MESQEIPLDFPPGAAAASAALASRYRASCPEIVRCRLKSADARYSSSPGAPLEGIAGAVCCRQCREAEKGKKACECHLRYGTNDQRHAYVLLGKQHTGHSDNFARYACPYEDIAILGDVSRAPYFVAGGGWFSLVGGTIPLIRK